MATLSAIRKQIQRLEAEAERITKQEMSGAIAKIKSLMSDFGITLEHLGVPGKPSGAKRAASKNAAPKRAGAGTARYADPKTGKTWSGFGRAPAWIAGAKDRDAFLVGAAITTPPKAAPVKRAKKAAAASDAPAVTAEKITKAAKKAPKKSVAAVKKSPASKKVAAAKKTGRNGAASKAAKNSAASRSTSGEGAGAAATTQ